MHYGYNTAQTLYTYSINYSKKNLDQTATGDEYRSIPSRTGVSDIGVSIKKNIKTSKNNKNQYKNVAEKSIKQTGKSLQVLVFNTINITYRMHYGNNPPLVLVILMFKLLLMEYGLITSCFCMFLFAILALILFHTHLMYLLLHKIGCDINA